MGTREGTGAPAGRGQREGFLEEAFELARGSHSKEVVGDAENSRRGNSSCKGPEAGTEGGSSLKEVPFSGKPPDHLTCSNGVPEPPPLQLKHPGQPDSSPPPKSPSCCRSPSASLSGPGVQPNPFRKGVVIPPSDAAFQGLEPRWRQDWEESQARGLRPSSTSQAQVVS